MTRDLLAAFFWKGVGIVATFLGTVAVARILGAREAGWVALGQSAAKVVSTVALLGVDVAVMRSLSSSIAKGARDRADETLSATYKGSGALLVAAGVISVAAAEGAVRFGTLSAKNGEVIVIGVVIALALATSHLISELLRGSGFISSAVLFQGGLGPLLTLVCLLAFQRLLDDFGVLWLMATGEWACAVVAIYWWHRRWGIRFTPVGPAVVPGLLKAGLVMSLISFFTAFLGWIELFAVSHWTTSTDAALLNAAQKVAAIVSLPLLVINIVAAPRYAALNAIGDYAALRSLVLKVMSLSALLGLPALAILAYKGNLVLAIFGKQFIAANSCLRVILVGQLVNLSTGPVIYLLVMCGRERVALACVVLAVFVDIAGLSVLVPARGLFGAGIADSLAVGTMNLLAAGCAYLYLSRRGNGSADAALA